MTSQSEHWTQLAGRLGIVAVAPFCLKVEGEEVRFAAMLPQFGGVAGMVTDPDRAIIEPYIEALKEAGFGYSAVTIDEAIDDEVAREMLRDWGWAAGAASPDWL